MAEPLWPLSEVEAALGAQAEGTVAGGLTGVSIDSRTLAPGDAFFAIRGERVDGHDYVADAMAAGAGLTVVSAAFAGHGAPPLIRVPDTLEALHALGRAGRARSGARVIAVTGSVGKTGTKEMLHLLCGRLGAAHASEKSYNNQWGVPLSLARMPRAARFGIFEAGMNHSGEITPLSRLIRPHVALITTVAPVHIGFFASLDDIAAAKAEIFDGLEAGGTAILNRDNAHFAWLERRARAAGASVIGFGAHKTAAARLIAAECAVDRSNVTADIMGERVTYALGAPGMHLVLNSLAALAAVKAAGGDVQQAAPALADFAASQGRGARLILAAPGGHMLLIDESYNANPASMAAALAVLGRVPRDAHARRIAVLGEMLELGAAAQALHRALAGPIDEAGADLVFACGRPMAALIEALPSHRRGAWAERAEGLVAPLLDAVRAGDAIMVKGSLGSRMAVVIEALKARFAAGTAPRLRAGG